MRTRRLDPSALPPPADHCGALRESYRSLVDSLTDERKVLDRHFYVVVPWDAPKSRPPKDARQLLEQRVSWVAECLRRLDLAPRRLSDHSLAELLRPPLDPTASVQPTSVDDNLIDFSDLVAPTALTEGATSLSVSRRHAIAIPVLRTPHRLTPG